MKRPVTVYVTTKDEQEARRLGRLAVERRLAACANIVPMMHSIYEWEGSIVEHPEAIVFLKTDKMRLDELTTVLREHHSYSVPCITAFPIEGGNPEYLDWINEQVGERSARGGGDVSDADPNSSSNSTR